MLMKALGLISRFIVSFTFLVISLSLLVLFFWADFLSEDLRNQAAANIENYLQAPWYIHFPPVLLALLVRAGAGFVESGSGTCYPGM